MAGYLYKKSQGASILEAGKFGAAMATLNIENFGPFKGNLVDVLTVMATRPTIYFDAVVVTN
jgi:sugar/nucleoside kinase (ribokinase family)